MRKVRLPLAGATAKAATTPVSGLSGSKVLPIEIPKTATAASASAEFGSIYDMKPGSAGSRTIKRAVDAYDQFVEIVEGQMVSAWLRQVTKTEDKE